MPYSYDHDTGEFYDSKGRVISMAQGMRSSVAREQFTYAAWREWRMERIAEELDLQEDLAMQDAVRQFVGHDEPPDEIPFDELPDEPYDEGEIFSLDVEWFEDDFGYLDSENEAYPDK